MKTFSALLALMKSATCWTWHDDFSSRGAVSLSIQIDDIPNDRRQCWEIRIPRETSRRVSVELRVLHKFDPVKNSWTGYRPQDGRSGEIDNRRGEKALREYVREIALILKRVPRPQWVSFTACIDGPTIAAHRESEAYLARLDSRNA